MAKNLEPIRQAFMLNNKLFVNTLNGMEQKDAVKRVSEHTNSVMFIACHVTDARYYMLNFLGEEIENPLRNILGNASSVEEVKEYPSLEEIRLYWKQTIPMLDSKLSIITDSDLSQQSKINFPIEGTDVLSAITFLTEHESYHIGQMAFLRKYLGYAAMMYS